MSVPMYQAQDAESNLVLLWPKWGPKRPLRQRLLAMAFREQITIDHRQCYCGGQGAKCSLAHYLQNLKIRGLGEWSMRHLGRGRRFWTFTLGREVVTT